MGNVHKSIMQHQRDLTDRVLLQGAKAQQKRERNADKNAPKGSKSQAKVNEAAKNIICVTCRQTFVSQGDAFLQALLSAH